MTSNNEIQDVRNELAAVRELLARIDAEKNQQNEIIRTQQQQIILQQQTIQHQLQQQSSSGYIAPQHQPPPTVNKKKNYRGGKKGRRLKRAAKDNTIANVESLMLERNLTTYGRYKLEGEKIYYSIAKYVNKIIVKPGLNEEQLASLSTASSFDSNLMEKIVEKIGDDYYWIPPPEQREQILHQYHSSTHRGINAVKKAIHSDLIIWDKLDVSITNFIRVCGHCGDVKDNRDIGLIVLVDHLTKHAWVETIQNKESSNVARFLEDVFVDIGLKEVGEGDQALYEMNVRSDNGGEFIAAAVAEMCKKYGVNKKEGPSYSPWVQGAVERLNQTLKRKLVALMSANNTQRWSQFVPQVVSEYNNAFHSTIKMKPIVAWRICWCSDPSSEPLANKMQRLGHIDIIRKCIRARGEAAREHYLRKNPNIPRFKVGDIVRVRVPQKYRSSRCYLFGRKGVIVDEQLGDDGLSLYRYKVKWLESGGIKPSQKPGDISPYIEARDLKTFYLGNNVFVEPATMDVDDDGEVIYDEGDYDEDDEHPVPPPVSHPPMLPPVLPPVSPPPVDAPPVSPQVINDGTLVISRKNKNKKRRRKPDSEEERVHKAAKHA